MTEFKYRARTEKGEIASGVFTAATANDVARALRQRNMQTISVTEFKGRSAARGRKPSLKDVALFSRQLSTMISSGLPLLGALSALSTGSQNAQMNRLVLDIRSSIEQGMNMGDAFARHEKIFGRLYVNMIRAAEVGGGMDEILSRLADFLEKDVALRGKIKSSMTYPASVITIAFGITWFMLAVIVPKFSEILTSLGTELPLITKILIALSRGTQTLLLPTILAALVLVFVYRKLMSTRQGRRQIDAVKLKIPLIGNVLKRGAIANFSSTLGLLIKNGVGIVEALEITEATAGNALVEEAVRNASVNVQSGEQIAASLRATPIFPDMVVSMISTGEETGSLDTMLVKISEYYEREVNEAIDALTAGIEPALMVFLGVVVGGIVIGLFMPLFSVLGTLSGG